MRPVWPGSERGQVRVDADRHDRRLAAAVDHLGVWERRRAGAARSPSAADDALTGRRRVRYVHIEVEGRCTARTAAGASFVRPEEPARSAGTNLEDELHLERIVGRGASSARAGSYAALPSPAMRRPGGEGAVVTREKAKARCRSDSTSRRARRRRSADPFASASGHDRVGDVADAGVVGLRPGSASRAMTASSISRNE